MKKLKGLFLSLLLWVYPLRSEPINEGAYILEEIGDVLRFLPIFVGTVSLAMRDYRGLGELAVGTLVTQGVIYTLKELLAPPIKMGLEWDLLNAHAVIPGEACQAGMLGGRLARLGLCITATGGNQLFL